jgi:hypothetical protein
VRLLFFGVGGDFFGAFLIKSRAKAPVLLFWGWSARLKPRPDTNLSSPLRSAEALLFHV